MSVNLMSAIFETEFFDIKDEAGNTTKASTAKLVLLAMADHANDEGEGSYPSVERLCRKTALSEQTIRNTFDALRYNGIISLAGKSKYNTNNHTINTKSFPKSVGNDVSYLTLYPLGGLTGELIGSNGSLKDPLTVRPESSFNHPEPSITDEEKKQANAKMDAILEQDRKALENRHISWEYREKFPEMLRPLADLCVKKFGKPSKRDLTLWLSEIGHWYDCGCTPADFSAAERIAAKYETPPMSPTGITKAIKLAAQSRKHKSSEPQYPEIPQWKKDINI